MRQFFKFMFASLVGTLLTVFLLFLIGLGIIGAIASMADQKETKVKENTILHIKLDYEINERTNPNPFENFDFTTFETNQTVGLNDILQNLKKASVDERISGIYLDLSFIPSGMATVEEIRKALVEFKKSGKFIISYAEAYDQKAYYLATVADEIYMNPEGMLMFKGLNAQLVFLKNMLNKIDVDMQVFRGPDNKYKSAVEPLLNDKMSEANREQWEVMLNGMWGNMLQAISESRGVNVATLEQLANNLDVLFTEKALENKMIDQLVYKDEILDILREKTGREPKDKIYSVSMAKYTHAVVNDFVKTGKNKIAVIYAQGEIGGGNGDETTIGSERISKAIRKAREDDKVKAILMRVNSPGGDALASDVIRREVELASSEKPFIVSMGNLAASGGYWISMGSDYIFADPTTITGSIGVFGVIPNMKGLMNDRFGITFDKVMTNENADFVDIMEPIKPYQEEKINTFISDIYYEFIAGVARYRDLTEEYVDGIAQGRVWTGADALEIGLVDELGGFEEAFAYTLAKAEVGDDYRVVSYPEQEDPFEAFMKQLTGDAKAGIIKSELGTYHTYLKYLEQAKSLQGVQARLPYFVEIK